MIRSTNDFLYPFAVSGPLKIWIVYEQLFLVQVQLTLKYMDPLCGFHLQVTD